MVIRLRLIEQGKELGVRPAGCVQFGEAYLCELPEEQRGKPGVEPKVVVVVQSMELCKNATEVYVAPVAECITESAFSFRIYDSNKAGVPAVARINLEKIEMMGVSKLRVNVGRLGARDLWRLDEGLKDLFGAGSN